jgi:hypothetical protein
VLDPVPGALHLAVIEASTAWGDDRHASTHHPSCSEASRSPLRDVSSASVPLPGPLGIEADPPIQDVAPDRWQTLGRHIDPALVSSPDWPSLAATLDDAAAAGYDVNAELPRLAQSDLPPEMAAADLRYRVLAAANLAGQRQLLPHRGTDRRSDREPREGAPSPQGRVVRRSPSR